MIAGPDQKRRLLIIEDNPGDVGLFRWALDRAGIDCELSVIEDGGAALEFVRREGGSGGPNIPDLVVLDLNLPKVSGSDVLIAMRGITAFANVPVVIWTSSNAPSDRARLNDLQINRYLLKPPELSEFLKLGIAIKEILEECGGKSRSQTADQQ
jgi:DNA-binding response OmpR family regulator